MTDHNDQQAAPGTDSGEEIQEKGVAKVKELSEPYDFAVQKDGLKVHPQPTSDPLDPLNWSKTKKHTILAIVMFK